MSNWQEFDQSMQDADPDQPDELELVYGALHHALESKCALLRALQQIEDVLEPGRWTLVKLHNARRIARDAIAAATCKVNPCSDS